METAEAIAKQYPGMTVQQDRGLGEVDFGGWTGERIRQLARTRRWKIVQRYPSGARFPDGESFFEMQVRVVGAIERFAAAHGGVVAVVSHADVIKAAFAHYAGIHLDLFQRIIISPASISIVALSKMGPRIIRMNDTSHYDRPQAEGSSG